MRTIEQLMCKHEWTDDGTFIKCKKCNSLMDLQVSDILRDKGEYIEN